MNHLYQLPVVCDCTWCTEESSQGRIYPHHYLYLHLLISLWGWLSAEPMRSFVATWMVDLACNQYHLKGGGVQPVPGCPSMEQVTLMNTCSTLPVKDQDWLKPSVDFYSITDCSLNPGSVFFSSSDFFPIFSIISLQSPCLLHLIFRVSCSLLLPHLRSNLGPNSLSSVSFYLLLVPPPLSHCLSLQSDDCGWRDARTERWRCDYCNPLFRMSVLAET